MGGYITGIPECGTVLSVVGVMGTASAERISNETSLTV